MTTILSFTVIILALILGGLIFYILKNLKNKDPLDLNSPEIIKLDIHIIALLCRYKKWFMGK